MHYWNASMQVEFRQTDLVRGDRLGPAYHGAKNAGFESCLRCALQPSQSR